MAGDGQRPTPQVHIANVAAAIVVLVCSEVNPPNVVLQPWEGMTTRSFLEILGLGRPPRSLPWPAAQGLLAVGRFASRHGAGSGQMRRLEMMLAGQAQEEGWLSRNGFRPVVGLQEWAEMAKTLANDS